MTVGASFTSHTQAKAYGEPMSGGSLPEGASLRLDKVHLETLRWRLQQRPQSVTLIRLVQSSYPRQVKGPVQQLASARCGGGGGCGA